MLIVFDAAWISLSIGFKLQATIDPFSSPKNTVESFLKQAAFILKY